jgi:hypothetical protein
LAVGAFAVACAGLATCGFLSLPGLVLGVVALVAVQRKPREHAGRRLAIAAIVVSGATLAVVLALALRVLADVRRTQARSGDHDRLYGIGLAIAAYGDDHGSAYPESLADLLNGRAYLGGPGYLLNQVDPEPQNLPDGTPCSYAYIGPLPAQPPEDTIIAYTRRGIFREGRTALYPYAPYGTIRWHTEEELTDPDGLLAQSYARVVEWLGDDLTEERDAELRAFYEIGEDGQTR